MGRFFPPRRISPTHRPIITGGDDEEAQALEFELPPSGNQSIAKSSTRTVQQTVRGYVKEVYVDIPRNMTASLKLDNSQIVNVTDNQGSTGIRQVANFYVVSAVAVFTNNKGTAQDAKFILRGSR